MASAAYQFRPAPTEGVEKYRSLDQEHIGLCEPVSNSTFEEIVGSSDAINRVKDQILKVARSDATVLITGESGTGKELVARAIHRNSDRLRRPLSCMNCAATPRDLIASELFGHEKGAFTDANQRRAGRFELADHGTLFLDEIGDMPIEAQCALLRVLQEHELERVGGSRTIPVDVRIIAATNCDLSTAIDSGRFRLDLFYRLNVLPIHVPALRERPEDILPLAKYFIGRYAAKAGKRIRNIDKRSSEFLEVYPWPGNIRELQNVIERNVILCDTETLLIEEESLSSTPQSLCSPQPPRITREKERIETVLAECRGRISGPNGAATKLGIQRTTLESWIRKMRINKYQYQFAAE